VAAVGILALWFGYGVFYYGLNTVTGGNDSLLSLVWPGRFTPAPRDAGGGASGGGINPNPAPGSPSYPLIPGTPGVAPGGSGPAGQGNQPSPGGPPKVT